MPVRFHAITPQGIGDLLWVYQKLAPLCDELHFSVVSSNDLPKSVVRRAESIIGCLPKVADIRYVPVESYPSQLEAKRLISEILPDLQAGTATHYAVNPWLESGLPLEQIDAEREVIWDLGVTAETIPGIEPGCVALYVSGDSSRHATICQTIWAPDRWLELVEKVYGRGIDRRYVPILLIGAGFDYPVQSYLRDSLVARGFMIREAYDLTLPQLLGVFGQVRMFLGYQSGLNVIAALAGAKQLMIYFPAINLMTDRWVHPKQRADGRFKWTFFDQTPATAAAAAPW